MATILGVPASPFVRKAMLAHLIKGIPFEIKMVPPGSDDETFRQASPLGKIPAYQSDQGTLFSDSSVIIAYLEKSQPSTPLYPNDAENFAKALWLEEYADTKMAEATNALYFQRVVGPAFFEHTTDEARVTEILNQLIPPVLNFLEDKLSAQYFVGDELSVADIAVGSNLMSLTRANYEIDQTQWPKLAEFYRQFLALDAVKQQLATEDKIFNR
ncbi:glutathione S-transferase family protein [Thalassotalea sp. LPB0316]|uniref:glutathione S-transferase family protein n=1 Tax=Thalassotalea sp. LPB0316 TaxID=2769490 RepID=UPI0018671B00|nr:glutathione S-transferase family protein [Thalassotalea sp. LPB0316]QOL25846.1 glutathione S-transferase family protein [Thalassotalea sp. LPB0316]